jgi:hypothetical protein
MLRSAFLLLLAALAVSRPAFAQSPAAVASGWGLLGTWRYDCNAAPDRNDVTLVFAVRGGRLFHDRNWGDGHDSSVVSAAAVRPDGTLDLTIIFTSTSQTRQNVYGKLPDGRWRTLVSRNIDTNDYLIRDGKLVSSGRLIAAYTRCAGR